jgi:hypothetical protein
MSSKDELACDVSDTCYLAVTTAYRELRARGETDRVSFHSALAVFRHHHPEVPAAKAPYVVAEWID